MTLPRAPTMTGTNETFGRLQSLWISRLISWYFSILSFSCSSILLSPRVATWRIIADLAALSILTTSGLFCSIMWSHGVFMSQRSLWLVFSETVSGLSSCHCWDLSGIHFSQIFHWIIFATLSCLLSWSFWPSFLHSPTPLLTVSPLSLHNLHVGESAALSM